MGVALALIGIFSLVLVDFNSPVNEAGKDHNYTVYLYSVSCVHICFINV